MTAFGKDSLSSAAQTEKSSHKSHKGLFVAVVLALVFLAAAAYVLRVGSPSPQEEVVPFDTLRGTIYLSMGPVEEEGGSRSVDMYAYNIETGVIGRVLEDDFIKMTADVSPDGNALVYSAARRDPNSPLHFQHSTPFVPTIYDFSINRAKEVLIDFSYEGYTFPRHYSWSPSGNRIAYNRRARKPITERDSWAVYVTDITTNSEKKIGTGLQAFWSPDEKYILTFQRRGAYLYDVDTGKSSIVATQFFSPPLEQFVKFKLSDDKKLLVWSWPEKDLVAIGEIISWNPFKMILIDSIYVPAAYYPVISPDNRYIAYEEIDFDSETETFSNNRLAVYDMKANKTKVLTDLSDYSFTMTFVDDWAY